MRNEIICPSCGTAFTIDESMYDSIVKQIRDKEFSSEIRQREEMLKKQSNAALELSKNNYESQIKALNVQLENQKKELSMTSKQELSKTVYEKDRMINDLKAQLASKDQERQLAVNKANNDQNNMIQSLNNTITSLKTELEAYKKQSEESKDQAVKQAELISKQEFTDTINQKDRMIDELKALLASKDQERQLAVNKANNDQNSMIQSLNNTIVSLKTELEAYKKQSEESKNQAVKQAELISKQEFADTINQKDRMINELKAQLASKENEINKAKSDKTQALEIASMQSKQEMMEAVNQKNQEITQLKADITELDHKHENDKRDLENKYNTLLSAKDVEINFYKDLKAKQSTKMIGETLEQHCNYEFNRLRPTAFRNAYFEKDNDARTGSKGDFIFKDYEDGTEYISIMFEMKNEADATASKHKNEDFFKELDKDRKEKGCEYAVLVSLLESDNELYNQGIVDVSYKYDKMYVIRPQFFIPLITLLRNAALNTVQYKKELAYVKNQNIDISHFEENMASFQSAFGKNYESAKNNFNKAIDEIDKSISHLQKIKDALTTSENQLRLANDKAQGLTIKKLTKNAPSVKAMFDAIDNE